MKEINNGKMLNNFKPMQLLLQSIKEETTGSKSYFFNIPKDFIWEEGANIHIALDGFIGSDGPDQNLIRHLSITTLPSEGKIGITTKFPADRSEFKKRLLKLKPGDKIYAFKPKNELTLSRTNKPLVLVSMGVGIAAIRPLILSYLENQEGIPQLINLNIDRNGSHIYKDELDNAAGGRYTNDWVSSRTELYRQLKNYSTGNKNQYYVIGSDEFIIQTMRVLDDNNVDQKDIIIDRSEEKRASLLADQLFKA